jgi:sec-independent protein translocase protein TatC
MSQSEIDASEAPLGDHLMELRTRLILCVAGFLIAFLVAFYFASELLWFLTLPFKQGTSADVKLISIKLLGVFLVKIKIAMFGGLFVAFPLIATQIYLFVAPGLYKNERNIFLPYLIATPIFFVLGAALVYFFLLPVAVHFFYRQAVDSDISSMTDVETYLDFLMTLILAFGVTFQLPVVLTLLGQIGIVSHDMLKKGRRFALVGVAILAGIITPPDPISMITMIIPLFALYELAVLAVGVVERRRKAKAASTDVTTST